MSASRKTICRDWCVPNDTSEQNITAMKPISESASALFSIARCRRVSGSHLVYSICEEVPLGTPESPIVSQCRHLYTRQIFQTWKRHGITMQTFSRKKCTHFLNRFPFVFPSEIPRCEFLLYYLSPKRSMLIAAIPFLSAKKNTRKRASSWKHRQKRV